MHTQTTERSVNTLEATPWQPSPFPLPFRCGISTPEELKLRAGRRQYATGNGAEWIGDWWLRDKDLGSCYKSRWQIATALNQSRSIKKSPPPFFGNGPGCGSHPGARDQSGVARLAANVHLPGLGAGRGGDAVLLHPVPNSTHQAGHRGGLPAEAADQEVSRAARLHEQHRHWRDGSAERFGKLICGKRIMVWLKWGLPFSARSGTATVSGGGAEIQSERSGRELWVPRQWCV